MPHTDQDYEAQADLDALMRSSELQNDAGRMMKLRSYVEDQKAGLDEALAATTPPSRGFNDTVRSKRSL